MRWSVLGVAFIVACSSGPRAADPHRRGGATDRQPDPVTHSGPAGPDCRSDADCGADPYNQGARLQCFAPDFEPGLGDPGSAEADLEARRSCRTCGPVACRADDDCPVNFVCADGACGRQPCTADGECAGANCVGGACYGVPGRCLPQAYCCPP